MTKAEIIEYLYDNNVRADITIEQMAEDLADRKTESDSEIPNNCEVECEKCKHFREEADTYMKQCEYYFMECRFEPKDEPTISKMEQVEITADDFNEDDESCENCRWFNPMKSLGCNLDDDECYYSPKDEPQTVRSNLEPFRVDEPQTNADQHVQRVEYIGNDERSRCWTCKHFEEMHETPIPSDGRYYTYVVCTAKGCNYEPKDDPQTDTEIARAIVHKMIDDAVIAEDAYPDLRQKMHDAVDEYEPQTGGNE